MTDITKIIQVNVTREDQTISRESFGIPLFLYGTLAFVDYIKEYDNLIEMRQDFATYDLAYRAAEKLFAQNPRPPTIKIGRRNVSSLDIFINEVVENFDYKTQINDTLFTYNSGATPTAASIAAGLVSAVNGGSEPVTATDLTLGKYELAADDVNVPFKLILNELSDTLYQEIVDRFFSNSAGTDIDNIITADNEWYVLHPIDLADEEDVAEHIETLEKIMITWSPDPDIVNEDFSTDIDSIAKVLHNLNLDRSAVIYTGKGFPVGTQTYGASEYIDCAWSGKELTTDPGSSTWANKNLNAIEADNLTGNQYDNAISKKANVYTTFAGLGMTRNGTVASGEYIDIIRGIDWFTARLRERLLLLLATSPKVPYTNHGILLVENQVRAQIQDGINVGLIDGTRGTFYVTAPEVLDIDPQDRIDRILRDVEFQWRAAGAIHTLIIKGRVTF
jgi:hypothetical protein